MKSRKPKKKSVFNHKWIRQEYDKGRSWNDIAKELKCQPNTLRRWAKRMGMESRNHSDAQKNAIAMGSAEHPTLGKIRDDATRKKISGSLYKLYKELPEEEKEKLSVRGKKYFNERTASSIIEMRNKAFKEIRKSAVRGSKMEKWIMDQLNAEGYPVQFHRDGLVPNRKMVVDLYIPALNTAIEIDGPSHFLPLYGEDVLYKTKQSDELKNSLLIRHGCFVVRIQTLGRKTSEAFKQEIWEGLKLVLSDIKSKRIVSPMVIRIGSK